MSNTRLAMLVVLTAAMSGLGGNCTPSTVDVPASQLEIRVEILDLDPTPSDGKVPVLVQPFNNGAAVQLGADASFTCNGVNLPVNGLLGYAERVPIVAAGGTYRIVHSRGGVNTQVVITVPARPQVTSPTEGQSVARSSNFTISYVADGGTSVAGGASDGSTGIGGNDQPDNGTATLNVSALHAGPGTVEVSRKLVATPSGTGFGSVMSTYSIGSPDVHVTWQ